MDNGAAHSCLSGAAAATLYRAGYACGYQSGMGPLSLQACIEETLATTFGMERATAAELAEQCAKLDER